MKFSFYTSLSIAAIFAASEFDEAEAINITGKDLKVRENNQAFSQVGAWSEENVPAI